MRLAQYIFLFLLANVLSLGCSSSAESWFEAAKARMKKGDLITAREAVEKALVKNPGYSEAYNLRGVINFQEKKIEEAILDYQKSVDLKPSNYLGQLNLASAFMEKNAWNGSVNPIEKAIKIAPDSSDGYLKRGIIRAALHQIDLSKQDFTMSLKLNPKEINAYYNRGNLYFQQDKLDSAILDFEQSISINSEYGKAYYALGLSYYKKNKLEKSCLAFNQANKLKYPGAKDALKNLCK
jgi:tetratricopeptide (TPR) repeat protein